MQENIMEKWYEAAQHRCSVRKYTGSPTKEELRSLRDFAYSIGNDDIRISVGYKEGIFSSLLMKAISGTAAYAAVIQKTDTDFMAGYIGEAFVLECTAMGLGTCWLGASYSKSLAKSTIKLNNHERIACIIAIGQYDEEPQKKRSRKSILKITGMEDSTFEALPDWQQCAIRCARLAPSAINAQPWEFDISDNSIQVVNTSNNFGYGAMDCGIAMLHIELGAAHCGYSGNWHFANGIPAFVPDNNI